MARVFSGVQPTGEGPHIGNYIGAFRRWVDLQDSRDECFYCVVDLHAMTLPWQPEVLAEGVRRTAATLIATGIDPERSILFVQSDVAAHTELAWILICLSRMGELGRMTQFKDKSRGREAESIGVGLFAYPVLMAADVLAYRAERVPVGDDQRQHLELMRDLAIRFNRRFGATFPVPEALIGQQGARIMSLDDPTEKMSKSSTRPASAIGMLDDLRSVLFVQSDVAEHTELAWILTCLSRMGELGRMTQFKDKSRGREAESIGVGLFAYPVLMAA
ncbi:MAG TPA: tryptophan--tRNA ligase, partial [Actinomycetota bacterium]